ncbi:ABC transporter permease [Vibrio fluvialis]|uniref:ABC transporter permease n=1 Tax=Vibrio fluvialis TaxID=676 RepID=UPI001EEC8770|nr:ABC transporter permease [Vibrio fluvialis]MCG6349098.1 ABC transporter permease [Vibrio fluvialis]
MLGDVVDVARKWRVVHLLGISTLRARYSRSKFGQAWLSLTTLIHILCIGLIWSLIWKMELDEYLPYVGIGHVIFIYFSQTINESTGVFVADARIYLNDRQPFFLSIGAHVYRNTLMLLHNIPTIILLVLWSEHAKTNFSFMFFMSLIISMIFLVFTSYLFAVLSTRFRDLIQLVGVLMQLMFLVTPVMWQVDFLPLEYQNYIYINPFASLLEMIRNPIIGMETNIHAFISLCAWTIISIILCFIAYRILDKRIIFWV